MQKIMGIAFLIVSVTLAFLMFNILLPAVHNFQTDQDTQTFAVETTSGTSATLTLTHTLYKTRAADVVSVESDESGDTPAVSAVAATKVTITGLATSTSRNITAVYDYDALVDYTGVGDFAGITPLLCLIAVIGFLIAGIWFTVKG